MDYASVAVEAYVNALGAILVNIECRDCRKAAMKHVKKIVKDMVLNIPAVRAAADGEAAQPRAGEQLH
jgi:hypothetical protein